MQARVEEDLEPKPVTPAISPDDPDAPGTTAPKDPKTATVLALLGSAALIFSYLGAYKVSAALVSAELISPWSPASDPRPKWLIIGFLITIATFALVGCVMRLASCRSLRDIDNIANDD
jgi:hypothetical protein